jgi:hypothetical protein
MNLFSPEHRFFYEDITGNGHPEFIYFDQNRIYYYNRNYKMIYNYAFIREMTNPPFLIHPSGKQVMVGFISPSTSELYLFDRNGHQELEAGIRGNTPFDIGDLENSSVLYLVIGSGSYLRCYRLSEF